MKGVRTVLAMLLISLALIPTASASESTQGFSKLSSTAKAIHTAVSEGKFDEAKIELNEFHEQWEVVEDGVKDSSPESYEQIEMVYYEMKDLLNESASADPSMLAHESEELMMILDQYQQSQQTSSGTKVVSPDMNAKQTSIPELILLLQKIKGQVTAREQQEALQNMKSFNRSWLSIESAVLSQSNEAYEAMESNMVRALSQLQSSSPNWEKTSASVNEMIEVLTPLSGKKEYTWLDATTILLREGLEALLVVVALLGFLKKSGHENKKKWIWGGVGSGVVVSIVLGVAVQAAFRSGMFGENQFLIAGVTGLFAAVMLLYMSYWLHRKSSLVAWQNYIRDQSVKVLKTGSLFSLATLAFLAIFREGTETVLFFIGMASSISWSALAVGIVVGVALLAFVSWLTVFVGMKIPVRPFFMVSSILVFYLCFKFTGMGIHGLQLSGVLPATTAEWMKTIDVLAIYPTLEGIVPQAILLISAGVVFVIHQVKDVKLRKSLIERERIGAAVV